MMIYTEEKYADLLAHQAKLTAKYNDVSARLEDRFNSDEVFDKSADAEYQKNHLRQAELTRDMKVAGDQIAAMLSTRPVAGKKYEPTAFSRFLRNGPNGLSAEERQTMMGEVTDPSIPNGGGETFVVKAATRSDDATGQELLQETVEARVIDRLKWYGSVAQSVHQISTATGNELRLPQHDQSTVEGELLSGQNTAVSTQDLANFGQITMNAYTASSKSLRITNEMIADSGIDIGAYANAQIVRRKGRLWERLFSLGTGTNEPQGLIGVATAGLTAATATSISWTETVNLPYQVDRAYRMRGEMGAGGLTQTVGTGMIGYMISEDMERILAGLKDGDNRPLWRASTLAGNPNMLNGYPYVVNSNMDAVSTGNVPMIFGDFGHYTIRTVDEVNVFRFQDSRTMQTNSIEILAFSRRDGKCRGVLVGGKCEAITKLTMA